MEIAEISDEMDVSRNESEKYIIGRLKEKAKTLVSSLPAE